MTYYPLKDVIVGAFYKRNNGDVSEVTNIWPVGKFVDTYNRPPIPPSYGRFDDKILCDVNWYNTKGKLLLRGCLWDLENFKYSHSHRVKPKT